MSECPNCNVSPCVCAKSEALEEQKDLALEAIEDLRSAYEKCMAIFEDLTISNPEALEIIEDLIDRAESAIKDLEIEPDEEPEREDTE